MEKMRDILIPEHLDKLGHNPSSIKVALWVAIILIILPIVCQGILLGNLTPIEYVAKYPERKTRVYFFGSISAFMFVIGFLVPLPLYIYMKGRNTAIDLKKGELIAELEAKYSELDGEMFHQKIIRTGNEIYTST